MPAILPRTINYLVLNEQIEKFTLKSMWDLLIAQYYHGFQSKKKTNEVWSINTHAWIFRLTKQWSAFIAFFLYSSLIWKSSPRKTAAAVCSLFLVIS